MIIPRDPSLIIPPMFLHNVTQTNNNDTVDQLQLFHFHLVDLSETPSGVSLHFEIRPLTINLSYLFVYHFDHSSPGQIDGWKLFCPSPFSRAINNQSLYTYFIDNERTVNRRRVIFGLRELNLREAEMFCSNASSTELPVVSERVMFTSNYELRLYTSSCLYFDEENHRWKSDGMSVGPKTNHYQTHCLFTH